MPKNDYPAPPMVTRRSILKLAGGGAIAASVGACVISRPSQSVDSELRIFSSEERAVLSRVQTHLFPSEPDAPGAQELNLTRYLELALTGTDVEPSNIETLKRGLAELKAQGIMQSDANIEALLRNYEESSFGDRWLRLVMNYSIEGYLGDPAYGGNTDQLGWRAVGHNPGVPRPTDLARIGRR